jgi:hypothetical protein
MPGAALAASDPNVIRACLSPGKRGTAETVAVMARLAMGTWGARSMRIRDLALGIVRSAGVAAKDYASEVAAIHRWVQTQVRYTRDPVGQETVQSPEYTAFTSRAGDCDDFTVLEAALLGALGHPTRFVTIGFTPRAFSHVYLEANLRGQWLPLDPIVDQPPGWEAPGAVIRKRFPINRAEGFDPAAETLDGLGFLPLLLIGGGLLVGGSAGYLLGRGVNRAADDLGLALLALGGYWVWRTARGDRRRADGQAP